MAKQHAECGCSLYDLEDHHSHRFLFGGHDPGVCGQINRAICQALLGYADARSQVDRHTELRSFEDVASRLLHNAQSVCDWLLPEGRRQGKEWVCGSTLGGKGILAAMGDTGKGMLTLDMALKVAACEDMKGQAVLAPEAFGCPIEKFGRVVILSAEDDHAELHRRIHAFDPDGTLREKAMDRLMVVPLPNIGGTRPMFTRSSEGVEATDEFNRLYDQFLAIGDLALIVVDPLVSFVAADLNQEGAAAAQVMSAFASLASDTGATVIAVHHMRKTSGGQDVITSPDQARAAIRGQSALVDGSRASYALWQAGDKEAQRILRMLDQPIKGGAWRKRVIQGAVVKANGPSDMTVRTFVRDAKSGFLVDHTPGVATARIAQSEEQRVALLAEIKRASEDGNPLRKTGEGGLLSRRSEMDPSLQKVSRNVFGSMVEDLISSGSIKAFTYQKARGLLDVPHGPFAIGMGTFREGA